MMATFCDNMQMLSAGYHYMAQFHGGTTKNVSTTVCHQKQHLHGKVKGGYSSSCQSVTWNVEHMFSLSVITLQCDGPRTSLQNFQDLLLISSNLQDH